MFISNKYYTYYNNIVSKRKQEVFNGYTEKHHIIPKSLGGSDEDGNIVLLSAREHFICHYLLTKFTTGKQKSKMIFAFRMMLASPQSNRYINSRLYEKSKRDHAFEMSSLHKGKIVSEETRERMSEAAKGRISPFKGKTHSNETKKILSNKAKGHKRNTQEVVEKIVESRKWYTHSEETKQKISDSNKGKTVIHTEETKQKISDKMKGRIPVWLKGKTAHNNGVPHTEETKKKISDRAKNRHPKTCEHCYKSISPSNYARWHGDNCKLR